jgi:hypothetical protein
LRLSTNLLVCLTKHEGDTMARVGRDNDVCSINRMRQTALHDAPAAYLDVINEKSDTAIESAGCIASALNEVAWR